MNPLSNMGAQIGAAYASGTADVNGTILDMAGLDWAMAIVPLGTIAAGSVCSIKWQEGDAADMSDAADLAGTGMTVAADDDGKLKISVLEKPLKRYCRLVIDKDASNAVAASITYLTGGASKMPVSHGANIAVESNISPIAGTA